MKRLLFLVMALLPLAITHAQSAYKGTLLNEKGEPIFGANVIQLTLPDSTMVKGAISDDKGHFELPDNAQGKPSVIKITHLEYKEKVLTPSSNDLGTISLQKSVNELGEVVVSATKPFMKQQGTLITTDIAASTLKNFPQVSMIIDFLPGVNKSAFGGIEVFGKKNPIIYINNRKLRSNVELMQLSPQEVESIDIETQPGAEYDNSVGAIIRIKLKKKQGDGLSGIVGIQSDFKNGIRAHIATSLNYRVRNTDFFLMLQPETKNEIWSENFQELNVKTQSQQWQVNSKNTQKDNSKNLFSKFGFNHEFSNKHSIGASAQIYINPMSGHTFADQENETYQGATLIGKNKNHYDRFNQNKSLTTNMYYEGKLSNKLKLQTDLDYQGMRSDHTSDILEKNLLTPAERNVNTHSEAQSNWWGLKTTFTQKVGKNGGLSYGFEGSTLSRNEDYRDNVLSTSKVENKELKSAVFTSYAFPWNKINFKAGLRYEYTDFDYFENGQKREVQSRSYRNVLPNISVSFPWDKTQWSFSYIKRIRRPAFYELSDYSAYSSSFLYNRGNPNIVPTLTDEFSWLTTYKDYSLSAEYSIAKDGIFTDYQLYALNPNVVEKTLRNFDTYQTLKLVLSAQHTIWKRWRPKTSLTFIKQFGDGVFENNNPVLLAGIDSQILFSQKWIGLLNMKYHTKGTFGGNDYNYKPSAYVDFIILGTFPKQSLQLYTGVTDIFNSAKIFGETRTALVTNKNYITNPNGRTFIVALAYRFNSTQNKYKGQGGNEEEKNRM
ncbi:outer membrane beta-barrel family protein [Capnocytophaga sputigena]|uniref:outer membrane beta-barrel family protein n=1 Tax=Capnocytophaga sputigena TaxID=1019 RepID=UPI00288A5522|nr:outer membrane beta-barrel family protein [Capnocytophaga sputigena]